MKIGRLSSVNDADSKNYSIEAIFKEIRTGSHTVGRDFNVDPTGETPITLKQATLKARDLRDAGNIEAYSVIKRDLPCYIFAGSVEYRNVVKFSGLVVLDFDDLSDHVDVILEQLKALPFVYACWKTLSGEKCIALVRVDPLPTHETFKYAWFAAYDACSSIARCDKMYRRAAQTATGAWDADLYINDRCEPLKWEVNMIRYAECFPQVKAEDGLFDNMPAEYVSALEEMQWKDSGWSAEQLPCMFDNHEFDGWDSRENGMGVRKLKDGYLFSCLKCDKSKIYRQSVSDVFSQIGSDRPRLFLTNTQAQVLSEDDVIQSAANILRESNEKHKRLFVRGNPVILETRVEDVQLSTLTEKRLSAYISTVCDVSKIKLVKCEAEGLKPEPVNVQGKPPFITNGLLEENVFHSIAPKLDAVITHPLVTRSGDVITEEGYNEEYKVYLKPNYSIDKIEILDSAQDALYEYSQLFKDFPFKDESSGVISLTYPLTLLLRHLIDGTAPLYHSGAAKPGTGKGLLFQTHYTIVTGNKISLVPYPAMLTRYGYVESPRFEEIISRDIGQKAIKGATSWIIDNIPDGSTVKNPFIANLATDEAPEFRELYKQDYVSLKNTFTVVLTGNNLVFTDDLGRRVVHCILEADVANPHLREGLDDLDAIIAQNRERYLSYLLTIASHALKMTDEYNIIKFGSFQNWANLMSRITSSVGLELKLETKKRVSDDDAYPEFFSMVYKHFGENEWTPKEVVFVGYADVKSIVDKDVPLAEIEFSDATEDLYGYELLSDVRPCGALKKCSNSIGLAIKSKIDQVFDIGDGVSVRFVRVPYSRPKYKLEIVNDGSTADNDHDFGEGTEFNIPEDY